MYEGKYNQARGHAGRVPPAVRNVTGWLQRSCKAPVTGEELYAAQDLFSIYVHRGLGAAPAPPGSVFAGRDIEKRCAPQPLCASAAERPAGGQSLREAGMHPLQGTARRCHSGLCSNIIRCAWCMRATI